MQTPPANYKLAMPAEWERHQSTWLSWPHNPETWPGKKLEQAEPAFVRMARYLSRGELVNINVKNEEMRTRVKALLRDGGADMSRVRFHLHPTNDNWCRDHGPIFVTDSKFEKKEILDWGYNAWGGKYPPFDDDNKIPALAAKALGLKSHVPGIIMEGGALEVNGRGELLTTETCLLNPNRNPGMTRQQIEDLLKAWLGVYLVHWLGGEMMGDDTDGHIDNLARFTNPDTIVAVVEENHRDANYKSLAANWELLQGLRNQQGKAYNLVKLPMPGPLVKDRKRLPASYANFYIANGVVLVPVFGDLNDQRALGILRELFPNHDVVGISAISLLWGQGGPHCCTMQEPAVAADKAL